MAQVLESDDMASDGSGRPIRGHHVAEKSVKLGVDPELEGQGNIKGNKI